MHTINYRNYSTVTHTVHYMYNAKHQNYKNMEVHLITNTRRQYKTESTSDDDKDDE